MAKSSYWEKNIYFLQFVKIVYFKKNCIVDEYEK